MSTLPVRSTLQFLPSRGNLSKSVVSVTRGSKATLVNKFKKIQEVDHNVPRLDHDPLRGELLGLTIEEPRTNLIKASEFFDWGGWSKTRGQVIPNQAIAPDGKSSADKYETVVAGNTLINESVSTGNLSNRTYTWSIWLKSDDPNVTATLFMYGTTGVEDVAHNSNIDVYGEWKRVTLTKTFNSSMVSTSLTARVDVRRTDTSTSNVGDYLLLWGAQLEEGSYPTTYIPTLPTFVSRASTKKYVDAHGIMQTASIDEEVNNHHEFIDGQWVDSGQLLEGSATNLFINSNIHSYVGPNITSTAASFIMPDGLLGSTSYLTNTNSGNRYVRWNFNGQINTEYTLSIYIYLVTTGTKNFRLTARNNALNRTYGALNISLKSGKWNRVSVTLTGNTLDTSLAMVLDSLGAEAIEFFAVHAQAEVGLYPTSYIPTSGSQVTRSADIYSVATSTRSADICEITGSAFSDFYNHDEGTFIVEASNNDLGAGTLWQRYLYLLGETSNDRIQIQRRGANDPNLQIFIEKGGITASKVITNAPLNEFFKIAFAIMPDGNTIRFSVNGGPVESLIESNNYTSRFNRLHIGHASGNYVLGGHIKSVIYFPVALEDQYLIDLSS